MHRKGVPPSTGPLAVIAVFTRRRWRCLGRTDPLKAAASLVANWTDETPACLRPAHVSLYGSIARGNAGPESDIDLLVVRANGVSRSDLKWAERRVVLILAVEGGTGRRLDLAELGGDELEDFAVFSPCLAEAVCEEGLTLHGPPLGDMPATSRKPTNRMPVMPLAMDASMLP